MSREITVSGDNISLDLLLVRVHGWRGQELIHETLQLNPGIAGEGLYLKQGKAILIPDLPAQIMKTPEPTIDLFG